SQYWHSEDFLHKHKIKSLLTVHPRAEPYRIEHSRGQFGSARKLFEPYIVEREHWDLDSVRLALENSERGGDSARKCTVRFGTVRGCTVRGGQSGRGGGYKVIREYMFIIKYFLIMLICLDKLLFILLLQ